MFRSSRLACAAVLLLAQPVSADDWPHWRGPAQDGRSRETGGFDKPFTLELDWKASLGSGYSGIVVSGGRAVTMFSDGESDQLAAFDVNTGKEAWRHRIDSTYKGRNGADDGPSSSPVIDGGTVYALGPQGKLAAVALEDGRAIWLVDLIQRFHSLPPDYGFATSPLVVGDLLIVQVGGRVGRAVAAFDKKTGETRWHKLNHRLEYQSPLPVTLLGRRQLLVVDMATITGIVPETGELLWTYQHRGTGSGGPILTALGGDRFLIKFASGSAAFVLKRARDGYEVARLYRNEEFSDSYFAPILHEGHLYGFTSTFLTCMNAETGQRVWRSRAPGGRGLVLVDGHLVISADEGRVVVAEATPAGFVEKAGAPALARSGYTWPSFSGGRVFVRNLEEIAALSIAAAPAEATPRAADPPLPTPGPAPAAGRGARP